MSAPARATTEPEHVGACQGYKCSCKEFDARVDVVTAGSAKPVYTYCICGHVQGTHDKKEEIQP